MKKLGLIIAILSLALTAAAVPARRVSKNVRMSDGTTVTVQLRGDETFHYWVTSEGTSVLQQENGDWKVDKRDVRTLHRTRLEERNAVRSIHAPKVQKAMRSARAPFLSTEIQKKKGLLILVNFTDKEMAYGVNSYHVFNQMLNGIGEPFEKNYGSVREYFRDQSYGKFDIEFDVVGPVTVAHPMKYYGENDSKGNDKRPHEMVREACLLVDDKVNFADYDWDGDGEVENIYITYAGYGEASGASSYCIWPHQWYLSGENSALKLDGVTVDTYACGSELSGAHGTTVEGIGVMCHEYSHCLGLPDFYDTGASKNFGMDCWSLMDYGCYNGNCYHPAGYTAYERWFCDWLEPVELTDGCFVKDMKELESYPQAYVIYNDKRRTEYYLLANHQLAGWDQQAYGHGLMVLHVDYNQWSWYNNQVNNVTSRQRMTIIPADDNLSMNTLSTDLWPSRRNKTELTDSSTPAATVYNANVDGTKFMHKPITEISESNGLISFTFKGGGYYIGVNDVLGSSTAGESAFYDLSGRRVVGQPQRSGFYIVGGRKVFVK